MMNTVSYGIGGFMPDHPNGNITARTVDNGDGTATRTTYDGTGQVSDEVTFPFTPDPVPPTLDEEVAELRATVAELLTIIEGT